MKLLISGARGMIGSALTSALREGSHEVVTLDRSTSGSGVGAPASRSVSWDPAAGEIDSAALERLGPFDAVVHLAGAGIGDRRWNETRKREIYDSRILSTRLLALELSHLHPMPAVFVCASAIGIYGDRGDEPLTEESRLGDDFLANLCRDWEASCQPADEAGVRVVNIRSGVVLSSKGGALRKQLPLFRFGLGGRLGSGRQYLSWITLEDEIGVIRAALLDPGIIGPLNSTAPVPVTNAEFTRELGAVLHRPTLCAVPKFALSVAFGAEMADEMLLASQKVVPEKLSASGHHFGQPDLGGALRAELS